MLKPLEHIQTVTKSIDRVEISLPMSAWYKVSRLLVNGCQFIGPYYNKNKFIKAYVRNNKSIQIWKFMEQRPGQYNPRFYIELFQPDTETLLYIWNFINFTVPTSSCKSFKPTINQLEIAHDIFTHNLDQLDDVKAFIDQHLRFKYSRPSSVGSFKDTVYHGKDGNIRKGAKGSRSYIKELDGGTVCRLELQLNRKYLRDNNIYIEDLSSLSPEQFDLFDHVDFLDDFSAKGLQNISRTRLRKRGYQAEDSRKYRFRANMLTYLYRQRIHGSVLGKIRNCVALQMDSFKQLKKDKALTVDVKTYCKPLADIQSVLVDQLESVQGKAVDVSGEPAVAEDASDGSPIIDSAERLACSIIDSLIEPPAIFTMEDGQCSSWLDNNRGPP